MIGTLGSDDGNGNQPQCLKKNWFNKQNKNSTYAAHFFVYFFAITDVKMPSFSFNEGSKQANSDLEYGSQEYSSKRVCLRLTK